MGSSQPFAGALRPFLLRVTVEGSLQRERGLQMVGICVLSKCLVDSDPDAQNRVWGQCGAAVQAGGSSTHGPEDGVSSACGPSNLQGLRTDHGITCTREGSLGEKRVMKPEHLRGSSRTRHRAFRPEDSSFLSLLGFPPHLPFFLMTSAKLPISPQVLILGNLATASHDYE